MRVSRTSLKGVIVIEPDRWEDERGFFMEIYQMERYMESGIVPVFVQDNISLSVKGSLRGLHYQFPDEQAKLVQALRGEIFDVAVDIRRESPTFGQWTGAKLSDINNRQIFIPEGFAHGFCVLSETALVFYKCTAIYSPASEAGIAWNDPDLDIDWPVDSPLLSVKDRGHPRLKDVPSENLPV